MLKKDKKELAKSLKIMISTKNCALILSHKQLTFSQIAQARKMSEKGTKIIKIKNKIAKKVLKDSNYEKISQDIKTENLFIFSEDIFEASKIAKHLEKIPNVQILKAASIENNNHNLNFISELASLGSKENLQSKLLNVINEILRKTLRVISERCEKMKEKDN